MSISKTKQQGSILFICLFIILILSILTASVFSVSILQERMSGNLFDQKYSFMAADASLAKAAERIMFDKDLTEQQAYKENISGNSLQGKYTYKLLGSFSYNNSIGTDNPSYSVYEVTAVGYGRKDEDAKTTLVATYVLRD